MITTKTYRGKSSMQILRTAKVVEMQAGNFEIVSDLYPGCVISDGEFDSIYIEHSGGAQAHVELSSQAVDAYRALRHQRGQAYYDGAR